MTPIYIEEYNYPLPDERIAKYPLAERDQSKLLVYRDGDIVEDRFCQIGDYLPSDSVLVYNNTRVIQARLVFHKDTGARVEVFCLEPLVPHDYQLSLTSTQGCEWKCMVGNLKKWKEGRLTLAVDCGETTVHLSAERLATSGNTHTIRFSWDNDSMAFAELLDKAGELPIPPYLNRATEEADKTTYQTVYSRIKGSVAAPTAGLHFTDRVLDGLKAKGIQTQELTLHVGAGTFQPVKTDDANQHTMHTEIIAVPRSVIATVKDHLGHIVAVGTTSVRTLESLYYMGVSGGSEVEQFEPYQTKEWPTPAEALQRLLDRMDAEGLEVLHGSTQIMIEPGYEFRIVDRLITNFHQPKSTLLLLVSAFVKGDWKRIYDYALAHDFRFLSYGDSSLLCRTK